MKLSERRNKDCNFRKALKQNYMKNGTMLLKVPTFIYSLMEKGEVWTTDEPKKISVKQKAKLKYLYMRWIAAITKQLEIEDNLKNAKEDTDKTRQELDSMVISILKEVGLKSISGPELKKELDLK